MAAQLTDGLRAASWMAIEIDVARIDPFDDVHHQWANIAERNAYNIVFSVGGLLPAAVALGVVAGLPVVVVHRPPGENLTALFHGQGGQGQPITVLKATVDRVRRVTVDAVEVSSDDAFTGRYCDNRGWNDIHTSRLELAASSSPAAGPLTVAGADGMRQAAQRCEVAEQPGVVLRAGIDDRWCHARSIAVRVLPDPLLVVDLDTVV